MKDHKTKIVGGAQVTNFLVCNRTVRTRNITAPKRQQRVMYLGQPSHIVATSFGGSSRTLISTRLVL